MVLLTISSLTHIARANTHQLTQKTIQGLRAHAKSKDEDETNDGIARSTTDDMFAFSQIIAGGEKVSEVTKALENEGKSTGKDNDEDEAILAFSNTLPGNADEPKKIEIDE